MVPALLGAVRQVGGDNPRQVEQLTRPLDIDADNRPRGIQIQNDAGTDFFGIRAGTMRQLDVAPPPDPLISLDFNVLWGSQHRFYPVRPETWLAAQRNRSNCLFLPGF
jgi:hypothetical protein